MIVEENAHLRGFLLRVRLFWASWLLFIGGTMRLESALFSSREGITAHGQALSVVGDNVSNVNTIAFRRSRAEFADLVSEGRYGKRSESTPQAGSGVMITAVRQSTENGIIEATGRELDVAIDGRGYFMVGNAEDPLYSRAGNFGIDSDGNLVTAEGLPVLGIKPGAEVLSVLNFSDIEAAAKATQAGVLVGNINSSAAVTQVPNNPETFNAIAAAAGFIASDLTVFDSLGAPHALSLAFYKTEANKWTVVAYLDGADVGGEAGKPVQVGQANLVFSENGVIAEGNAANAVININANYGDGAQAGNFTLDLAGMTQYAGSSMINRFNQDGQTIGSPQGLEIDKDGGVYVRMSGGSRYLVGALQLANFTNVDGLDRVGGSLYRAGTEVGEIGVAAPGAEGRGVLRGGGLERSSVDLSNEFVDLVLLQRGYQANSQILNATSTMLRETIGLIR